MSVKTTLSPAKRAKSVLQNHWAAKRKFLLSSKDTSTLSSESNSEDKNSETHKNIEEHLRKRRLEKVLKSLEVNLTPKFSKFPVHSDSEKGRTRLRSSSTPQPKEKWLNRSIKEITNDTELPVRKLFSENFSDSENTMDTLKDVDSHENNESNETFEPISWNSQIIVSDTIFNVSSVLSLPQSPINSNNLNQNYDEKQQESDTSIIDAIKLRRVNPTNDVSVKRCLELKVESTELDVLRRVQVGVANFIEKELKHKQLNKISSVTFDETTSINSESRIDQKIKDLVEATFRKNVDTECWGISEHTKAIYQPRVVLERLDIAKESKHYNINNISTLKQNVSEENLTKPFNLFSRKRQSVLPRRYSDYQTSLDTDPDYKWSSSEEKKKTVSKSRKKLKSDQSEKEKHIANNNNKTTNGTTVTGKGNTVKQTSEQSADYEDAIRIQGAVIENHICGLCGNSFNNREDVEIHVRSHRDVSSVMHFTADDIRGLNETPQRKEKIMRCKRCKELVEERCVKEHSVKCNERSIYKCYLCERRFVTAEQLSQHFSVDHGQQCKVVIDRNKNIDNTNTLITQSATRCRETEEKTPTQINKNDIQSHKITSTAVRLEDISCFLCDKVFTDEELLKNHLQEHCDEVPSDDEQQSKEPEQYQCGICGESMKTEELLQEHVNQHLYNESSSKLPSNNQKSENNNAKTKNTGLYFDNIPSNLKPPQKLQVIPQVAPRKRHKQVLSDAAYQCSVCDELFDADKLTEHISLHKASTNVCQLCDKPFRTEEELQDHVMTHM
ncbi:uncharacterized protein LOC109853810 isoform X2 [Pseudomyrmex gracilis]|nr:uncharacterized protein LOC109853810 isoform X2 [Pseudomyrmex gracilis]